MVRRRSNGALFVFAGSGNGGVGGDGVEVAHNNIWLVPHGILMTILSHDVVLWTFVDAGKADVVLRTTCPGRKQNTCLPPFYCHVDSLPLPRGSDSRHYFTATWIYVSGRVIHSPKLPLSLFLPLVFIPPLNIIDEYGRVFNNLPIDKFNIYLSIINSK